MHKDAIKKIGEKKVLIYQFENFCVVLIEKRYLVERHESCA